MAEVYEKGGYLVYRGHGVCRITDIQKMQFGAGAPQEYWVLTPLASENTTLYLPVSSPGVQQKLRPVLTPEEIDGILRELSRGALPWEVDRKLRLARFQEILARRDTRELLLLAGCLYSRKQHAPLSPTEQELLRKAEALIEQEFSLALGIPADAVGEYIRARL